MRTGTNGEETGDLYTDGLGGRISVTTNTQGAG